MKRALSFSTHREVSLLVAGTTLIAGTYGLVRLAYGLFLPDIEASLGFGSATAGYISSGASVAYCLGAVVGLVVDRRPRLLVLAALGTGAIGAIGMALSGDMAAFVPAAIVGSAGAGLASPGLVGLVARNVPAGRLDRSQAVVNSGTGPGLVAAGALALVLLPHWRIGFLIGALITAGAGLAVLALDRLGPAHAAVEEALRPRRWWAALSTPAVGAVLLGAASAAVWTYGRTLLITAGLGAATATVGWMAVGVGGTATVLTASRLAALPPARAWALTAGGVAAAIAVVAYAAGVLLLALTACLVFGWAFVAATSALIAWVAAEVPGHAAAGTSVLFIGLTMGQAMGSAVAGAVAERGGLELAFTVAGVTAAAAAGCGVRVPAAESSSTACTRQHGSG